MLRRVFAFGRIVLRVRLMVMLVRRFHRTGPGRSGVSGMTQVQGQALQPFSQYVHARLLVY